MASSRADATRAAWLAVLDKYKLDPDRPAAAAMWSPRLDGASRDEITAIQNAKLAVLAPFLYENSAFYRRRFDRLGLAPSDIRGVDDLAKWPVVDKREMMEDALAHPPYGSYSTMSEAVWAERGWMMFASSGSTGVPRVFRYSQIDRDLWAWANARAMLAMGIGKGDTVFMITGFGPHVWAWGVQFALAKMGVPAIPGGGMDAKARAGIVLRFRPTVLLATPSYALRLGRVLEELGHDPAKLGVRTLFLGGEPAMGIAHTRERIQESVGRAHRRILWLHRGGAACRRLLLRRLARQGRHRSPRICSRTCRSGRWSIRRRCRRCPTARAASPSAPRSIPRARRSCAFWSATTPCSTARACACGRNHARAVGAFAGRADDLINLRGIKMFPVQIEEAVRALPGAGDEFEIVIATDASELDVMTVRIEHADHAAPEKLRAALSDELRARCEVRVGVDVLAPGTLPKTEFKAKRVRDLRAKP